MNKENLKINNFVSNKFQRRQDLTLHTRLHIAFVAMFSDEWGTVTQLAKQFFISRTFVYMLEDRLWQGIENSLGMPDNVNKAEIDRQTREHTLKQIILYRMEGKCSIPAISQILKHMDMPYNSIGNISNVLGLIGQMLPSTLELDKQVHIYVYLASDEIFSHSKPILISVDPISSAILKIEMAESRQTSEWEAHFKELKNKGFHIIIVVCDQGISLNSAATLCDLPVQADTFHAISHRLGKHVSSLEKSAYAAINEEYIIEKTIESAKTENVLEKRLNQYFQARQRAFEAIELYENFKFLYHVIIEELVVFDKDGNVRNRQQAEGNIKTALDFLIELPIPPIKKEINTIYNCLDDLLNYLDNAEQIIWNLQNEEKIPVYLLQLFALCWQYQKNMIKAKHSGRKNYYKEKYNQQIQLLEKITGDEFQMYKEMIFMELDKIIQSSAMVENINSIVRSYFNTSRNHINQNMLNLIMFYHNHRRFIAGKRKGKTPLELLTGVKQDKDWYELLLEKTNQANLFSIAA
jgi:hypothetical protein